jgi:hypothetical protein
MDAIVDMMRENHRDLSKKVDEGFEKMTSALVAHGREDDQRFAALDLTLLPLQETHNMLKWARRTVYGAVIIAIIDGLGHVAEYVRHVH